METQTTAEHVANKICEADDSWVLEPQQGSVTWFQTLRNTYIIPARITVRVMNGRITIASVWPSDSKGCCHYPRRTMPKGYKDRITMSASKSGEQVAREIRTRLMPHYLPMLAKMVQEIEEAEAYDNRTTAFADKLKATCPALKNREYGDERERNLYYNTNSNSDNYQYGDMEVYDKSVNMKLSVSHEVALKIAAVLDTE